MTFEKIYKITNNIIHIITKILNLILSKVFSGFFGQSGFSVSDRRQEEQKRSLN